jgi:hypothetical protein
MAAIEISKDVLAQELNGETVLLDLASERYFGLDEVSTRVWQLLHAGNERHDIIDILLKEYDVQRGDLEKDIADLFTRLSDAGLVTLG